ncbi:mitotic-spindle organizing protein 1 [Cryptococcus neoformans]|uniref:Mitotic-spindle organizing protein 1 n=2 Tax=Cryptococcus neoformans TaxID=5207 RepID=A0A854QLP2_CRYNE|nr:mitotic spindle organizing protein 1 [Cryptococcus neoformans var. grubii H99]AUB21739.1 mitotic spindle organizing protein 1 [Cryptococcus neoformans var. grubii]OWT41823.1 mitotic-spindle organizing protein 1 [Cryptococcus neoformans var. grubii Bt1]OWZ36907.1 mitotic-spindle organizing protein 1 [Cryptococcus neoformans var. grubii AD2-60a]OWZ48738.1 mitotic-spindle organizing protein 1 [Cryptococcus neoformans var. grubii C23]OWZ58671.1 mitotic-spindle organizing protein 1 [Cryptococcus|eukprot:XP_012046592.1 mitotic spindle organizing protein 1 [Cryptococcus neoformans var. grubii H99]
MSSTQDEAILRNARETIDSLYDLSQLLQTGLDKSTLSICVGMIEQGANPDTLAAVIKELRSENEALNSQSNV